MAKTCAKSSTTSVRMNATATLTRRRWLSCCSVLLACGLCGAFLPPPAALGPTLNRNHRVVVSLSDLLQRGVRSRTAGTSTNNIACRMQQEGGNNELQLAVKTLAAQVQDLTTMVKQLADDTTTATGGASQIINGAAVENNAAVPVAPSTAPAGKGMKAGPTELVR